MASVHAPSPGVDARSSRPGRYFRPALRVAVVYVVFGGAWVLGSDLLLEALVTEPGRGTTFRLTMPAAAQA